MFGGVSNEKKSLLNTFISLRGVWWRKKFWLRYIYYAIIVCHIIRLQVYGVKSSVFSP